MSPHAAARRRSCRTPSLRTLRGSHCCCTSTRAARQRGAMAAQAEAAKVTMAFDQDEFFACARYGELDDLKKELDKGADVNGKGPGGFNRIACALCEWP